MNAYEMKNILLKSKNFDEYFPNYISYNPIPGFEKFEELNSLQNDELNNDIEIQKMKNELILNDLKNFSSFCADECVKYVGLKGIFITLDLYCDYNKRTFTDVDLFVAPEDSYKIYSYWYSKGYRLKSYTDLPFYNSEFLTKYIRKFYCKHLHHLEMIKNFECNDGNQIEVLLEIHFNLNTNLKTKFNMKKMIQTSILIENNGVSFYRFNDNDYYIYLCVNICAHIAYICPLLNNLTIDLQKLNDIIKLVSLSRVDWQDIIKKSIEYNVVEYVGFISNILYVLTNSLISKRFLDDLNDIVSKINFNWKHIYLIKLTETSVADIILGVYDDFPIINHTQKMINEQNILKYGEKRKLWKQALKFK